MLNSIPAKICFICVNHLFVKGSQRLTYCLTLTNFLIILACLAFWGTKYNESDSPIASDCIINNFSCLCIILRIARLPLCFGGRIFVHLPTLVAVLLLKFSRRNPDLQSSMFVGGEVLKVVLSLVSMLVVFAIWHRSLVFYPFLLAFLGVSHLVFLVLLRVKHYGR